VRASTDNIPTCIMPLVLDAIQHFCFRSAHVRGRRMAASGPYPPSHMHITYTNCDTRVSKWETYISYSVIHAGAVHLQITIITGFLR